MLRIVVWLPLLLVLVCCGPADQVAPSPAPSSAASSAAAQATLNAAAAAVLRGDHAAYQRLCSRQDPLFAAAADRLFTNLAALPLVGFDLRLRPQHHDLTAARRAVLGSEALTQAVAVRWQVVGDIGPAEHQLWLTFLPSGTTMTIAGTADGPDDHAAEPLWSRESIGVRRGRHTTVIAATAQADAPWLARGDAAVAAVRRRLRWGAAAGWNGDLVLEIPSSRQSFERTLGVAPDSYAALAAAAWPEGPDAATAAVRIVINPAQAATLDDEGLAVLLTHETVHVATRSAASAAPSWLVEGFADYVAYDAHPRTAPAAAAGLLTQVRDHGAPAALPTDPQFSPTAADLPLAYAQAWWACRLLAQSHSASALNRFYRAVSDGTEVDSALRSSFGETTAQFTAQWRRSLTVAASRA